MTARRVAITGIGAWTSLGAGVAALAEGLRAGRVAIGPLTLFSTEGYRSHLAAQAPDPASEPDDPDDTRWSRPDRFGLAAAREAVAQAGLQPGDVSEAAVVFGTGTGGAPLLERYLREEKAGEKPSGALLRSHQPASVTDLVARRLAIRGPRATIMTACSSSATAIGVAADRIRRGQVAVAIAGGAEGLCPLTYAGFGCLRALSPEPCRPFDVERKGLTLGEGGAALVLEDYDRARGRGATVLGLLAGWGLSADAHHMTAPHPEGDGAYRAMRAALDDAGLSADAVGYVNAHGTGTPHNDAAEAKALARLLGARAPRVPVSSSKSMFGHTLGAAGAIEAVATLLAMRGGFVPPTASLRTPEPAFELDYVPVTARAHDFDVALSSSFAFGGNNTVLVLHAA